jgi:hypothetical protein
MSITRRTGVIPAENVWMSGRHGVLSNRCLSKRNKFNRDPQDWIDLAAAEARCGGVHCGGAMVVVHHHA